MINKKFAYKSTEGLPGGPNELKKFIKGSISITGYKSDSPDLYNDFNIIPSNRITMQDVEFPVLGIDNLGNEQMMMPGGEYQFPGDYVTELPQMGKGGLTQWFAEEWTDVKTGKKCGRSGKEKGSRPYPACRPKKRVNETTPKTTSEMSSAEKAKFKREKTSGKRISYNHKRKEFGGEAGWLDKYQPGGVVNNQLSEADIMKFLEENDPSFQKPSMYDKIITGTDIATDIMQMGHFIPHPAGQAVGTLGDVLGAGIDAIQSITKGIEGDYKGAAINAGLALLPGATALKGYKRSNSLVNHTTPGVHRPLTALPHLKDNPVIKKGLNWNRATLGANTAEVGSNFNLNNNRDSNFRNYQDNTRVAPIVRPVKFESPKMQDGGTVDPEMMFRDKYNTELTPSEKKEFDKWVAEESKRQGRDILMDMGAYDIKGFWKSGDYKNMDSDNHGTDTWKKPNHPTFSNQSRYHGADGWYGGNWTDKGGYQPSKQTLETYGPDYYDWMFKSEPGRIEHLDMSRYKSGANAPSPFIYQDGGHVIQPGETFYGIANKYGIPKESFIAANPDLNINRIRAGQRIHVPEEYSSVEHEEYPTGYFSVGDEKVFEGISKFPKEDKPKPKKETKTSAGLTDDILLRQAFAESTFNPKAKSPAGYMGLGQIGDAVIKDYKKATGVKKVDPYNPAQNAAVQKWAMNQIYNADFINKENQDPNVRLAKTLASYNWGKGNVKKYLTKQKAKGVDIYNSLDWVEGLPKETRDYIHKIQLSDMPEFEKGFNKAVKDKKYLPYINLYKKKYGGWLDTYSTKTNWLENYN